MKVFALTGFGGGKVAQLSDIVLAFPDTETPRIQEAHLVALHNICYLIERALFSPTGDISAKIGIKE
jgi:D-sedoheptulose 7-phosphate isomerase